MNEQIYRMIVRSVMTRMPSEDEQAEDFFIGFDRCERPFLLLPTPDVFTDDALFAIRLVGDPLNRFWFTLESHFTRMPFSNFHHFFDDKTYFFGPEDNMLKRFLKGRTYQAYTEWMRYLSAQPTIGRQIS